MTKVFISWSGDESKAVAEILRDWLPSVIQAVQPWMSAEDIEKGARWSSDVAQQLEQTKFGIICLTPHNLNAPWIHFEAGALSKTLEKTFLCPYLFRVTTTDIAGPLTQFQATYANKDDTKKLLLGINRTLEDNMLSESTLEKTFAMWWPQLEDKLNHISKNNQHPNSKRSDREILEELLELARAKTYGSSREMMDPTMNLAQFYGLGTSRDINTADDAYVRSKTKRSLVINKDIKDMERRLIDEPKSDDLEEYARRQLAEFIREEIESKKKNKKS